jgi:PqqD family protein of HPr-rel-A system
MTDLDDAPVPRDGLVVHELAGEAVVFEPGSGDLHRLNPPATTVWVLLAPDVPLRQIAADIAEATGSDVGRVEADVLAYIERLMEIGLLQPSSGAAPGRSMPV